MIRTKVKPPKKLSDAIMMALFDLSEVEMDPKLNVFMEQWHRPKQILDLRAEKEVCNVCFAGSVMAKTIGVSNSLHVSAGSFSRKWHGVFLALNEVRLGRIKQAISHMHSLSEEKLDEWSLFADAFYDERLNYEYNPEEFKSAMIDAAAMLRANGY